MAVERQSSAIFLYAIEKRATALLFYTRVYLIANDLFAFTLLPKPLIFSFLES